MSKCFKILITRKVGTCIRHVPTRSILWHCSIAEKFVCQSIISAVPSGNGNFSDDNSTGDVTEGQMKTHSFTDQYVVLNVPPKSQIPSMKQKKEEAFTNLEGLYEQNFGKSAATVWLLKQIKNIVTRCIHYCEVSQRHPLL
jgi:hypothetical protein